MTRFNKILLMASAIWALPSFMMAKQVTLHYVVPQNATSLNWAKVGAWVYSSATQNFCTNKNWPGDVSSLQPNCKLETLANGMKVFTWEGDIPDDQLNTAKVIFNDGTDHPGATTAEKVNYQTSGDGFAVKDGMYYDYNGAPTDTQFEMVVTNRTTKVQKVFSMSPSRIRRDENANVAVGQQGNYSSVAFSVGVKDEILPGTKGDILDVFVRGKNYHDLQFRPSTQIDDKTSFGNDQTPAGKAGYNGSLSYFGSQTCMDRNKASNSNNTFVIKKGDGVSYTVGLWNDKAANQSNGLHISFKCNDYSLSLHVNKSIAEVYKEKYHVMYGTTRDVNEDYYLIGSWNGNKRTGDAVSGYLTVDASSSDDLKTRAKMMKKIYLNPKDKNVIDSVVYSKIVKKPDNESFDNLYLSFVPQTIAFRTDAQWGGDDCVETNKYNFVARAEVQDQFDATAQEGCVFFSGNHEKDNIGNGQQAINPKLTDEEKAKYKYYIIRLNVTTSTYRIEFVDVDHFDETLSGVRTYCNKMNLKIPSGCKAFVAHAFKKHKAETKGQHGDVEMRELKFIPAGEGVVLVTDHANPQTYTFNVITDADDTTFGRTNTTYGELIQSNPEEWWVKSDEYKNANGEEDRTYNNYLVPALDDVTIENGIYSHENNKYEYFTRHFALNYYHKTKYYKSLSAADQQKAEHADYLGFFRASGKVTANHAYLGLPKEVMDYNGQIMGDFDSNNDGNSSAPTLSTTSQAKVKMTLSFDDVDGNTTSIEPVINGQLTNDDAYYTLQGLKVVKPTKGIYVHQGKKIVIK